MHKTPVGGIDPKTLRLDDDFASLNRELTDEERETLKASIQREGIRDPLVIWDEESVLLDGHNRRDICIELGLTVPDEKIHRISFASRDEAMQWAINCQLGRRNLTDEEKSDLRGREYNLAKKSHGGKREASCHDDNLKSERTAKTVAEKHGVSERTIHRDAKFSQALQALPKEERQEILQGQSGKTKEQVIAAGRQKGRSDATRPAKSFDQRAGLTKDQRQRIRDDLAREHGASKEQVDSCERLAESLETMPAGARRHVLSGQIEKTPNPPIPDDAMGDAMRGLRLHMDMVMRKCAAKGWHGIGQEIRWLAEDLTANQSGKSLTFGEYKQPCELANNALAELRSKLFSTVRVWPTEDVLVVAARLRQLADELAGDEK